MKKYKHTWFNGMIEVPNGEYVKEKEASNYLQQSEQRTRHYEVLYNQKFREVADQNLTIFFQKWVLILETILVFYLLFIK